MSGRIWCCGCCRRAGCASSEIFNCLVAIVFCAALVWYGWQIVDTSLMINETSSTDLQFPMWIYYLALPVGSALMLLRYIMRLVRFALFFDPRR